MKREIIPAIFISTLLILGISYYIINNRPEAYNAETDKENLAKVRAEKENELLASQQKSDARNMEKAAAAKGEDQIMFLLREHPSSPFAKGNICATTNVRHISWLNLTATHSETLGKLEYPIQAVVGKIGFKCHIPMSAESTDMEYYVSGAYFSKYENFLCSGFMSADNKDPDTIKQFIDRAKSCTYIPISEKIEEGGKVFSCSEYECPIDDFLPKP